MMYTQVNWFGSGVQGSWFHILLSRPLPGSLNSEMYLKKTTSTVYMYIVYSVFYLVSHKKQRHSKTNTQTAVKPCISNCSPFQSVSNEKCMWESSSRQKGRNYGLVYIAGFFYFSVPVCLSVLQTEGGTPSWEVWLYFLPLPLTHSPFPAFDLLPVCKAPCEITCVCVCQRDPPRQGTEYLHCTVLSQIQYNYGFCVISTMNLIHHEKCEAKIQCWIIKCYVLVILSATNRLLYVSSASALVKPKEVHQ